MFIKKKRYDELLSKIDTLENYIGNVESSMLSLEEKFDKYVGDDNKYAVYADNTLSAIFCNMKLLYNEHNKYYLDTDNNTLYLFVRQPDTQKTVMYKLLFKCYEHYNYSDFRFKQDFDTIKDGITLELQCIKEHRNYTNYHNNSGRLSINTNSYIILPNKNYESILISSNYKDIDEIGKETFEIDTCDYIKPIDVSKLSKDVPFGVIANILTAEQSTN